MGPSLGSNTWRIATTLAVACAAVAVRGQTPQSRPATNDGSLDNVRTLIELELFESALLPLGEAEARPDPPANSQTVLLIEAAQGAADDHLLCENRTRAARRYQWLIEHLGHLDPDRASTWSARARLATSGGPVDRIAADRRSGPWAVAVGDEWRTRSTDRFVIYHRNDFAARRVEQAVHFHFREICSHFGVDPAAIERPQPVRIYLHPTRHEMRRTVGAKGDPLGRSVVRLADGEPAELLLHLSQDAPLLLSSVLPHELAHLVTAHAVGYRPLPPYLDEGLALQVEPPAVQVRYDRIEQELQAHVPLSALIGGSSPPTPQREADYARARLCADFLILRLGLDSLLEICRQEGDLAAAAVNVGPWSNVAEMNNDWSRFAR
jgi:hypothetical protein